MNKTMEKRLFHSVPTEMAVDRGTLPPPFEVSEGGQCVNAGIQSKLQNTTRKIPHVCLPSDALTFSLQQSKEVTLHGIAVDASGPCIILLLTKNSPDLLPDGRHFWDRVSLCWNGFNLRRLWAWFHNWVQVQWKVKIPRLCMLRVLRWLGILWFSVVDGQWGFYNSSTTDYRFLG
jgi:hypothetical protein